MFGESATRSVAHIARSVSPVVSRLLCKTSRSIDEHKSRSIQALEFADPSTCRAVRLAPVMQRCGAIFSTSTGSEATYQMSAPVLNVDTFISHTWVTSRLHKMMLLALHFNLVPALAVWLCVTACMLACVAAGYLPMMVPAQSWFGEICVYTRVLHYPALLLPLLFLRDIAPRCVQGPFVFLDKVCIHQTDKAMQKQGIAALAAFIRSSRSMVVIYSHQYLRRLWPVYEMASLLLTNPGAELHILPTLFWPIVLGGSVCMWMYMGVTMIVPLIASRIMAPLILLAEFALLRHWFGTQRAMRRDLEGFDIRSASCYDETDRSYVENNVVGFMHAMSIVEASASREEVLGKFNELVRSEVAEAVASSFGRAGIPYSYMVVIVLPVVAVKASVVAEVAALGASSWNVWVAAVYGLLISLLHAPNCFAVLALVARRTQHAARRCSAVWAWIAALVTILLIFVSADRVLWLQMQSFDACLDVHAFQGPGLAQACTGPRVLQPSTALAIGGSLLLLEGLACQLLYRMPKQARAAREGAPADSVEFKEWRSRMLQSPSGGVSHSTEFRDMVLHPAKGPEYSLEFRVVGGDEDSGV